MRASCKYLVPLLQISSSPQLKTDIIDAEITGCAITRPPGYSKGNVVAVWIETIVDYTTSEVLDCCWPCYLSIVEKTLVLRRTQTLHSSSTTVPPTSSRIPVELRSCRNNPSRSINIVSSMHISNRSMHLCQHFWSWTSNFRSSQACPRVLGSRRAQRLLHKNNSIFPSMQPKSTIPHQKIWQLLISVAPLWSCSSDAVHPPPQDIADMLSWLCAVACLGIYSLGSTSMTNIG